ncbi:MAG: hypothetical protein NT027_02420 [Proteobacteria bacterium]|nr:hypothetical protein [Pseudomonadota bacterium]
MKIRTICYLATLTGSLLFEALGLANGNQHIATGRYTDYDTTQCTHADWKRILENSIENGESKPCPPGMGKVQWLENDWSSSTTCQIVNSNQDRTIWRYEAVVTRKVSCSYY